MTDHRAIEGIIYGVHIAEERAANGGWPMPETPNDYLMWIGDEYNLQMDQFVLHPNELDRYGPIKILAQAITLMWSVGIVPSRPPWEAKNGKSGGRSMAGPYQIPRDILRQANEIACNAFLAAVKTGNAWTGWPDDDWFTVGDFDLNLFKTESAIKADLYRVHEYDRWATVFYREMFG